MADEPKAEQAADAEQPALREITKEELARILDAHRKWVESGRKHGQRADLRQAELSGANLQEAKLHDAELREANLQDADLTGATGLLAGQLAGANVSGAKLPEAILKFEGLAIVEEISRMARRLLTALLVGCVYLLLTIATTTDARLLTNSASSPLPIIQTPVPIAYFYLVAPLLLVCLYLYFHLYLQRLWEQLARLPAVFPDGRALDERAHPWLLNGLVRAHFKLLRPHRPAWSHLQEWLSVFLAWWPVPITLVFYWGRYLSRHDWWGSGLHVLLLVASIGFGLLSYRLAGSTLRGETAKRWDWKGAWKDFRLYQRAGVIFGIVALFTYLSYVAIGPASGVRADLSEADVSTKPPDWTGQDESQVPLVRGAKLRGADLRHASCERAFLVNADLLRAKLQAANLTGANLQGAVLFEANLQAAELIGANLQGANLLAAKLQFAQLGNANLQFADLRAADLQGAQLSGAKLQSAQLLGANLQSADLRGADVRAANLLFAKGLSRPQLEEAEGWKLAFYDDPLLQELGLPSDHNQRVRKQLGLPDKK